MTETTNEYVEELQQELQRLSLDAVQGDEVAVQRAREIAGDLPHKPGRILDAPAGLFSPKDETARPRAG